MRQKVFLNEISLEDENVFVFVCIYVWVCARVCTVENRRSTI